MFENSNLEQINLDLSKNSEKLNYKCPVCSSIHSKVYLTNCKDILYHCEGEWVLLQCKQCDVIYTALPKNVELSHFYPSNYLAYAPASNFKDTKIGSILRRVAMLPYWIRYGSPDLTEKPFGKAKFLDVGCGNGRVLKQAVALGWQTWGIDMSPYAIEVAKKNVPYSQVRQSNIIDFDTEEQFDFIIMSHVLEHLPNPVESLQKAYQLLSPAGKILISIPNVGSREAKLFGKAWIGLDVPRHVVHFSEPVIRKFLTDQHFSNIKIKPAMFSPSVSESLLMTLPESVRYRIHRTLLGQIYEMLMVFPAAFANLLGSRGAIDVMAQKL